MSRFFFRTINRSSLRDSLLPLILLPLILLPFFSSAQQFNFRNYSVEDGIAQSQVYSLIEDSRGYLWMGTRGGGITRFDGLNFKTFSSRDGLSNNYISVIFEDKEKNIWIGSSNGISRYNGLKFENFYPEKSLEPVAVTVIIQDLNGSLWLGTNKGIYIFDPLKKEFYNFSSENKFFRENISCLYQDRNGDIWASGESGLGRIELPGGFKVSTRPSQEIKLRIFTSKNGLGENNVRCISEDAKGNLWVGTYDNGLFLRKGEHFFRIDQGKEFSRKVLNAMYRDLKGNMWMGTLNDGVCKWNAADSSFTWFNTNDGLSNNHVRAILEDKWGSYWFGTSGGGICKYYGQLFTHYTTGSGLGGNYIYSVFMDSRKRIWVGNSDKGVCVYDSARFIPYSAKEHFRDAKVRAIGEGADSSIWLGTDGEGLTVYKGQDFRPMKEFKGMFIRDIQRDSSGNMWVASTNAGKGIYKVSYDSSGQYGDITVFNKKNGLPQERIMCLHIDKYNRVWFGTESMGIGYIRDDSVMKFIRASDSLASDNIRCMAEDRYGYLWVGTAGNGISRINLYGSEPERSVKNIGFSNGLTSANIYLLSFDSEGNLFSGTETGIDKINLDKDRNILSVKHFGKAEGFIGIETCQNAVCSDNSGNLWFGTINGLTRYNPKTKVHNDKPPLVSINQVSLFYEPLQKTKYADALGEWNQVTKTLVFPHDQNHISFDISAINLSNPENVKLSWMLDGFDKEWSPPSDHTNATYSNLPPGEYTFLARAYNEDNVGNAEPVRLHFFILKPFWAEWWFVASVAAFVLLTLVSVFRIRVSQVKRRGAEQRRRLQMEKSMVELEQKALRLQMNPHFIFNALNSIQSLISRQDEQTARFYLAKFSKLMRMILENSRVAMITLDDEIKTLENYLAIEKFCSGDSFDYKIEVADGIDTSWITLPPMMIQPFAENALIHGLKHLDKRGEIVIAFEMEGETLVCTITDNGIGRKKAAELNLAQRESQHKSTALKVTQERLDLLQKEEQRPSLEILDLQDGKGNAIGTRVVIRVNVRE